jgi:hypothetical protein
MSSRSFASSMKYVARRSGSSVSNPESMESSAQTHNFLNALHSLSHKVYMSHSHRQNLVANSVLRVRFLQKCKCRTWKYVISYQKFLFINLILSSVLYNPFINMHYSCKQKKVSSKETKVKETVSYSASSGISLSRLYQPQCCHSSWLFLRPPQSQQMVQPHWNPLIHWLLHHCYL